MKKVVITGASGFLGRTLIKHLSDEGSFQIYALTSDPDALRQSVYYSNTFFYNRDFFSDSVCAKPVFENAYVINCAFPRNSDGTNMAKGLDYINRLFYAVNQYNSHAVINISSQSVYSQKRTCTADESTILNLESIYATGKYASELMLDTICRDLPHTNLRISSLIGPDFNQRITNRLIDSIIANRKAKVSINDRRFGFMDVRDAAAAILSLFDTDLKIWKEVYCVGTGRGYTLVEISDTLMGLTEELLGFIPDIQKVKTDEMGCTSVSGNLLRRDSGFECQFSLCDSLRFIYLSKLAKNMQN